MGRRSSRLRLLLAGRIGGLLYEMVLLDEVIQVLSSEDDPATKFDAGKALPDKLVQNTAADL